MSAQEVLDKDVGDNAAASPGLESATDQVADASPGSKRDAPLAGADKPKSAMIAAVATDEITHRVSTYDDATTKRPYFFYQNYQNGPQFLLHPAYIQHQNRDRTLYDNYGTTLLIIILLHIIYFYQWNKRFSKQDVCTNYDQLVVKKQYYRAVVAVMSHPPVDGGERGWNVSSRRNNNNNETSVISVNGGDAAATATTTGIGRFVPCFTPLCNFVHSLRRIKQQYVDQLLRPLLYGSLSGLPLLAYCSHILWQCRALEELYVEHAGMLIGGILDDVDGIEWIGTPAIHTQKAKDSLSSSQPEQQYQQQPDRYAYFRVLVALTSTALLVELGYLRLTLRRLDQTIDYDNSRTSPRNLLKQRAMVSLGSLCAALLTVYDSCFPFTPIPLLPFVRVSFLSNSGFSKTLVIFILFLLCHRVHPVTSVFSGVLSGVLWSLQITSFLGSKYWGDMMLWTLSIVVVLSLKANSTYSRLLSAVIPCLDHVAWNRDGEVFDTTTYNTVNQNGRNNTTTVDLEMGDTSLQSNTSLQINGILTEHIPLLSQPSTISVSSAIRGRVPRIDTMDS